VAVAGDTPILDLPVGTAFFTVDVARHHPGLVVGADIATGMVNRTRATARERGTPNLVAVQADAHRLPFDDSTFGAILCINGIQVMPDLPATLSEFHRVLNARGTLFVSTITAPLSAALPNQAAAHLPTLLKSRTRVLERFAKADFEVTGLDGKRLAFWFEATPG